MPSTWWWGAWFNHQNLRDDRAEAFAYYVPAGTYEYTFVVRATTPGTFVVPPTKAEEIYSPEVFGRTATYRDDAWNTQGLFDWERELVDAHFPKAARIAVLAAGGGREVLALRDLGPRVGDHREGRERLMDDDLVDDDLGENRRR